MPLLGEALVRSPGRPSMLSPGPGGLLGRRLLLPRRARTLEAGVVRRRGGRLAALLQVLAPFSWSKRTSPEHAPWPRTQNRARTRHAQGNATPSCERNRSPSQLLPVGEALPLARGSFRGFPTRA